MATNKTTPKASDLCFVQVGLEQMLIPHEDALALMRLVKRAVLCNRDYREGSFRYTPVDRVEVSVQTVRQDQIVARAPAPEYPGPERRKTLLLEGGAS